MDGNKQKSPSVEEPMTLVFGANRPKMRGTSYTSAGGGEVYFNPADLLTYIWQYVREEGGRQDYSSIAIVGPDLHSRPPQWMEEKNVSIDGTPITENERKAPNFWQSKYKRELDIAEAIQEVKRLKRVEATHDVIGFFGWVGRKLGWAEQLDENLARQKVEARHRQLGIDNSENDLGVVEKYKGGVVTPWKVFLESVDTGQPFVKVANEYRPSVDFYALDSFLDSAPSLIWFTTKCGIAMGIAQGAVKTLQAMNADVQFLKASGVGILSILNLFVFASVIKWGGNCALFSTFFCIGDRLATLLKYKLLPPHDARRRSTSNYVFGLAMSGGTAGILPWWILGDVNLALRLCASGVFVGGLLGFVAGVAIDRVVALNTARLEATNRELRRYEALMRRQRAWADAERKKLGHQTVVWW